MRFTPTLAAAAVLASTANAAYKGFNYGSTFGNGQGKVYADFKYEFEAAKGLPGTNGQFTSARLYTMIQAGTTSTPISAIQAAIDTQTSLLLGIWTSAGQTVVSNEIAALKAAASQYGTSFTNLVAGISVGSEDLYRITPTAIENGETNPGVQPSQLVNYIQQVRAAIKGTGLAGKPVGHVDTWTAYVNGSNAAVIDNLDFLGVDAYPYWQTQMANSIGNANATFYDAYRQTVAVSKNKPVWVTETGWPISGPQQNQAVASANNARIYWEDVTCSLIQGNINLWYYTLQDVQYSTPSPSFGIKPGGDLKAVNPLFDLSCPTGRKSYTAQISPTRSTLFRFESSPLQQGKTCNLVFHVPPPFDPQFVAPYTQRSPGGISVSRLDQPATEMTSSSTVSDGQSVGSVPSLLPGNSYTVSSGPCEAGIAGYRVDSVGGYDADFFQMTGPPAIGLFVEYS
ncbi:glycoside hydrolase family 17 protein [Trematosphaeria pertusa]|uniref:Probable glucan endo-1,3-beta-glucosidase eglC n=1 Tax=Trematosphaeria pertusa TaxID=390896 RepID=A0A6A6HZL9_9PLEO|nr:glycoside hydrolase family 17 protein [Trematosphaeria pertusa]KAF2243208.1 glycoside hydrolase family 17 protein [Trematosphaeria pertusa]